MRDAVGAALLETPDDGQLVITGSLYVVGAARGIFVKWSETRDSTSHDAVS